MDNGGDFEDWGTVGYGFKSDELGRMGSGKGVR